MDHHDDFTLKTNYLDLNPHRWNKEYMNSSGLTWLLARNHDSSFYDQRAWAQAAGATQDYCVEDNQQLFETVKNQGMIGKNFKNVIRSGLMEIARKINVTIQALGPRKTYDLLQQAYQENTPETFTQNDQVLTPYHHYLLAKQRILATKRPWRAEKVNKNTLELYLFNEDDVRYTSEIAEERLEENLVVAGYNGKILLIRALIADIDARGLVKQLGGGGPHPRVAGARTTLDPEKLWQTLKSDLKGKRQRNILEYF